MRITILMTSCLALAACGADGAGEGGEDGVTAGNGSPLDALTEAPRPRAGQWTVEADIIDLQMPGMPDSMREMMKDAMGQRPVIRYCLTPEQAEQDPEAIWKETNGDCRYEEFSLDGGKVDAVAVCKADGGEMRMTMTGTQSADAYSARNEMEMKTPQGDGLMIVEIEGRRTGDCDGSEMG